VNASTFPCAAALVLFVLGGCATTETAPADSNIPDPAGWVMSSGKPPTTTEFAALAATCEAKGGAADSCLTDLGLKKAQ
jgi:hypothetical protein